jgi:hypothetical protein
LAGDDEVATLRLLELYDDTYGLVNHDTDPSPFSLVSQIEQEDSLLVSGFGGYIDEFLEARVYEFTGISFDKYMTYTYAKQKLLIARAVCYGKNRVEEKGKGLDLLTAELAKLNLPGSK